VTTLGSFLTPFMGAAVNVALPRLGADFGLDAVELGWVSQAFLLAAAVFLVPVGRLADIHGRRRLFFWGMAAYALCSLACALAPSAGWLIAGRALQGAGASMIFGTSIAIVSSVFPPGERGRALGINVAAVYMGLSLGPVLGGFMTRACGWRAIFHANFAVGILLCVLILWKLRGERAESMGEAFDWAGSLAYAAALTLLMTGISALPAARGAVMVAWGGGVFSLFLLWEVRHPSPVLPLGLFRHNLLFLFSNLAALIHYAATFASGFLLSLYLQSVRGMDPRQAGLVLAAQPLVMALTSPMAGRLSDRVQPRLVASAGMALAVVALLMLSLLTASTPMPYVLVSLGVIGLGLGLFSSPNTNAIMGSVDRKQYGLATGVLSTMRATGMTVSMAVVMLLFSSRPGSAALTPEAAGAFLSASQAAYLAFAALCVLGLAASLARGNARRG
jgi:EmrB/QacA subfamily drug resistance transporter